MLAAALALAPIASAQAQVQLPVQPGQARVPLPQIAPPPLSGDMQDMSRVTFAVSLNLLKHNLVEGLPFAATGAVVVEQTLADGSAVKNSYGVAVWRDNEGRLRVEYATKLPGMDSSRRMVMVWDPTSSTNMTWSIGNPQVPVVMIHHTRVLPIQVQTLDKPRIPTESAMNVQKETQLPGNPPMANTGINSGGAGANGGYYQVGNGISAPVLLHTVEAEFSDEARRANYQGFCIVQMIVDTQGNPQNVRVIRPLGMGLDEKAVEAAGQYRFKPAMMYGKTPVPVMITVEVNFHLQTGTATAPVHLPRSVALPSAGFPVPTTLRPSSYLPIPLLDFM
jgi:TonB family protein